MSKAPAKVSYRYFPTSHAIDQTNIRFGVERANVTEYLNELMRKATYTTTQPHGAMVYETGDIQIIVDKEGKRIITVKYVESDLPIHDKVRTLVQRQLRVAEAAHRKQSRAINIERARQDVAVAQLRLNQQLAKSPVAQAQIERKIALVQAALDRLTLEQRRADEVLETERRASKMYGVTSV